MDSTNTMPSPIAFEIGVSVVILQWSDKQGEVKGQKKQKCILAWWKCTGFFILTITLPRTLI